MRRIFSLAACLAVLFAPATALAQSPLHESIRASASLAKDLEFPAEPSSFSAFSSVSMAIYKPEGAGPFPALVLLHQCGGLGDRRWQNIAILNWAKEAVARGYVAFVIDSLGPRNVETVCMGAQGGVNFARGARDALQAAEHLRKFAYVDKKRIALAGYSWGAMVGAFASSKVVATALSPGERFAAVVSFYPGCFTIKPPAGRPYEVVNRDIDRPLLVLMGDKDNETPPEECVSRLEPLRAAGAPVEWHIYKDTTHCWDCENLHRFSKIDSRGNRIVYEYDKAIAQDSAKRMFEFLQQHLKAGGEKP